MTRKTKELLIFANLEGIANGNGIAEKSAEKIKPNQLHLRPLNQKSNQIV